MSFTYGGTNTESLAGVTATLTAWPSLGGLNIEAEEIPGRDGRFYAGSSRTHSTFAFDVIIQGATPAEAGERRDAFVGALDPSEGPRPLVLETDSAWTWPDVMATEGIEWDRMAWDRALGFHLRADVTLETQGQASALEADPQKVAMDGAGSFTLDRGNTSAYPRIEFAGGAACVVKVGGYTLNLAKTPSGSTVVLDWSEFEFFVRSSAGKRTASAVPLMSNFKRPMLRQGAKTAVSVTREIDVAYEWTGKPNDSESVKKVAGKEVARNLNPDPRATDTKNYSARGAATSGSNGTYISVVTPEAGDTIYVDPKTNFKQSEVGYKVGDVITFSAEVRVSVPLRTRVRINAYSGFGLRGGDAEYVDQQPSDGWITHTATATVDKAAGYFRALIWPKAEGLAAGDGFDFRNVLVIINGESGYFDGDTKGGPELEYSPFTLYPNARRI